MFISLELPQILVKSFPQIAPTTEELAMLGDTVIISYGNGTLTGVVVEGDPYLDSWGDTWFRVQGTVIARDGLTLTVNSWVTDRCVIEIIQRA